MSSLGKAFAHFGAVPRNVRWSWSARSEDGKTVVLALWSDRFRWKARPLGYDGNEPSLPEGWLIRPGSRERLEKLKWVRDKCNGLFRVVIATAVDINADPREIASCDPKDDWIMQITELNEAAGEFQAVMVEGS